jgi:hypothetical protein
MGQQVFVRWKQAEKKWKNLCLNKGIRTNIILNFLSNNLYMANMKVMYLVS